MEGDRYKYFRLEARDLLAQFASDILALEKNGNRDGQVKRLLRLAHTLKGAARVVKLPDIANKAHAIEDILAPLKEESGKAPRNVIEALLKYIDEIDALVRAIDIPAKAPAAPPISTASAASAPPPRDDEQHRMIRADIAEMDALLDGIVEAHTVLNGLRAAPRKIGDCQQLVTLLIAQLAQRGNREESRHVASTLDRAHATANDLRQLLGGLERALEGSIDQMDRELGQLRDSAEQLRLVSAGTLFSALERLARDIASGLHKRITFEATGADIFLDSFVLSTTQNALVQIVRNAIAHGVEPESERVAVGKPPAGRIALAVFRREGQVVFKCADDGRGIDYEAIRRKAAARGLPSGSTAEIKELLLQGGISTSASVTDAAGRGVGMDVVRTALTRLGGKISLETNLGVGTTFELAVPLSVGSLHGLLVEVAGDTVTIPLDSVKTCLRLTAHEIAASATGASILYEGKAIPFVPLARVLFGANDDAARQTWSVVIVASGPHLAAIGVDQMRGTAWTVVRPLSARVPHNPMVAGASYDAEGNPQLVLDAAGLIAEVPRVLAGGNASARAKKPILVVDDSLTTRMLEQSILESAGYFVALASSAEEGLENARRNTYALALVDVDMPGMDGFSFVEQARADPALHNLPIILVTSRNAPEDIQRGKDVRANGYVVKGEFDQTKLLSMIKPLVAAHG